MESSIPSLSSLAPSIFANVTSSPTKKNVLKEIFSDKKIYEIYNDTDYPRGETSFRMIMSLTVLCAFTGLITYFLFGIALWTRTDTIAHRAGSRPKNVVYNRDAKKGDVQYRGNPFWGWIPYIMSLSYEDMLKGIPGTGTRNDGLTGKMLQVNLDGILLLRYHDLGLRISLFAMIMHLGIIAPIYYFNSCEELYVDCYNGDTQFSFRSFTLNIFIPDGIFKQGFDAKLNGVVLVSWVVLFYTCYELTREWTIMLALRRVYYLEHDHWKSRKKQLQKTFWSKRKDDCQRPPWYPDPEQNENVPCIQLYSVLVGGLPASPHEEVEDVEKAVEQSRKQDIDWQLNVTKAYFDHCVPNQPGFTSSIAAVTILPGATAVADAWGKWYAAAKKLRRLRFIRKTIASRLKYGDVDDDSSVQSIQIEEDDDPYDPPLNGNIYDDTARRQQYNMEVLGLPDINKVVDFGPEQTAIYTREFAQSASACCPNGFCEGRVVRASIDELQVMEREAEQDVWEKDNDLITLQKDFFGMKKEIPPNGTPEIPTNGTSENFAIEAQLNNQINEQENEDVATLVPTEEASENWLGIVQSGKHDWDLVKQLMNDGNYGENVDGRWHRPTIKSFTSKLSKTFNYFQRKITCKPIQAVDGLVGGMVRESTYAVVTFTSRQAALAARQCLADGRASLRWEAFSSLPVPPLAEAAPCRLCPCRGFCKPVTVNIPASQKFLRRAITYLLLAFIFTLFTLLLVLISAGLGSVLEVAGLDPIISFDGIARIYQVPEAPVTAILRVSLQALFFACCPIIFKSIVNFSSTATSLAEVEYQALVYYWYFMLFGAFIISGTIAPLMINALLGVIKGTTSNYMQIALEIGRAIPDRTVGQWLMWIILKCGVVLPTQYLLQMNTFLLDWIGLPCLARMTRGGGPGGPTPYRVYIDSGIVLLCVFSLSPVAPIVSISAVAYFVVFIPILRRNHIFMYRPYFDAGGIRWPFLFNICIGSMIMAQILLSLMMISKKSLPACFLAAVPIPVIILFAKKTRKRFLRSYKDAALLQTSRLDMWDSDVANSTESREEFRRFLVDSHKAAYVPVCMLNPVGGDTAGYITAEPAVVLGSDQDMDFSINRSKVDMQASFSVNNMIHTSSKSSMEAIDDIRDSNRSSSSTSRRGEFQKGVTYRRLKPFGDQFSFRDEPGSVLHNPSAIQSISEKYNLSGKTEKEQ